MKNHLFFNRKEIQILAYTNTCIIYIYLLIYMCMYKDIYIYYTLFRKVAFPLPCYFDIKKDGFQKELPLPGNLHDQAPNTTFQG